MKKNYILIIVMGIMMPIVLINNLFAQKTVEDLKREQDTLNEKVTNIRDVMSGVEERIATAEADLAKLTKIKVSGYLQAQWLHNEAASSYPSNLFQVRRARVKFTYEPVNGVVFVVQPDFLLGSITLKDAYAQANDPWLKTFSLWVGQFNRPNYEVEYSSSNREVPERSRIIRALYPGERAIGAKLEIAPPKLPLKVQLALFNGNDGLTITDAAGNNINPSNNDFDNAKDFMGRITYAFKLGNIGGLTIGAHGYYGKIKANSYDAINSDYSYNKKLDNIGETLKRNWIGFEGQLYLDLLGGLSLKGEYIFGVNSTPGYYASSTVVSPMSSSLKNDTLTLTTLTTRTTTARPAITRNFSGYYIYLVKNIGKRNQIAIRFDYYNPNTKLSADQIGTAKWDESSSKTENKYTFAGSDPVVVTNAQTKTVVNNLLKSGTSDIAYSTWTFGYTYFFDDHIKFMVAYEIPMNKKVGVIDANGVGNVTSTYKVNDVTSIYDYSNLIKQNVLTVRMQVKF